MPLPVPGEPEVTVSQPALLVAVHEQSERLAVTLNAPVPPPAGAEALVGEIGEVTELIDGKGMVFVAGELWRAAAKEKIPQGSRVRVTKVDGLTVEVEAVETKEPPAA